MPPGLLSEWLDTELARLRGEAAYTSQLTAHTMALQRASGRAIGDALDAIRAARTVAVDFCIERLEGVSHREIYEILLKAEAHYVTLFCRLHAEEDRRILAAAQRLQRAMAESMGRAFVVLDNEGAITFTNSCFADVVGIPEGSLVGRPFPGMCDPATAGEIRRDLRQKRTTSARVFEGRLLTAKGVALPKNFSVLPMYDESGLRSGVAVTISSPEDGVEPGKAFHVNVVGEAAGRVGLAVFLTDASHRLLFANEAARQLSMGREGPPCSCPEYGEPGGGCGNCVERGAFDVEPVHRVVVRLDDPDGGPRWHELFCTLVPDESRTDRRIVKVFRDITQEKTLENQVLRQQSTSLVSQLAMTVAHQLRNPLGVMIGYAEILSRGMPAEQMRNAVEKVLRNGIRCKEIVEDLLEFGKGLPNEQVVEGLNDIIIGRVQPMYPASLAGRITWKLSPDLPQVACVPQLIAQVLVKVIDNALWAARDRVIVESYIEENVAGWPKGDSNAIPHKTAVCVKVQDDGPGVPKEARRRIFDPFFTTRKDEGNVGLGLSLARSVIEEHGGHLFLDESVVSGACFIVRLPAAQQAPTARKTLTPALDTVSPGRLILIVDDEKDLLEMLATALELRGYRVDTAATASRALELVKRPGYDLAVLDILLQEDLGGRELYQIMRSTNPELARRTLFITADTMSFETRQFLEQVHRPYLEKPFLVSDFVETVDQIVESP